MPYFEGPIFRPSYVPGSYASREGLVPAGFGLTAIILLSPPLLITVTKLYKLFWDGSHFNLFPVLCSSLCVEALAPPIPILARLEDCPTGQHQPGASTMTHLKTSIQLFSNLFFFSGVGTAGHNTTHIATSQESHA